MNIFMNPRSLSCHACCISLLLYLQDNSSLSSPYTCAFEFRENSSRPKLLLMYGSLQELLWGSQSWTGVSSPYCLCLCSSLSQKEKSSELDLSPKKLFRPTNITKFNEHVDTFREERPTDAHQGWKLPRRHFTLGRYVLEANYCLHGSSRISEVSTFLLWSLDQCLAHSKCSVFIERRKEGEMARKKKGNMKTILSHTGTLKSLLEV